MRKIQHHRAAKSEISFHTIRFRLHCNSTPSIKARARLDFDINIKSICLLACTVRGNLAEPYLRAPATDLSQNTSSHRHRVEDNRCVLQFVYINHHQLTKKKHTSQANNMAPRIIPRKKVAPTSMQNLTQGRMLRAVTYNPDEQHAIEAWASLSKGDKLKALAGKDERNFRDYDMVVFTSQSHVEAQSRFERTKAHEVHGATREEIKKDFAAMGILWVEPDTGRPKRAVRRKVAWDSEGEDKVGGNGWSEEETEVVEKPKKKRKMKASIM